ncbi:MAG: DUF2130 domain-containing protein [Bacilli bacterium]|nr:DUF2130 domain-containing protein [Bacilli bacterium]
MKKIKVMVKDKNTLILLEDAKCDDVIDLSDLNELDYDQIELLIEKGKDTIYLKKLEEYRKVIDLENQKVLNSKVNELNNIISTLNNKIDSMNKEKIFLLKDKENEVEKRFIDEINKLKNELERAKLNKDYEITSIKNEHNLVISDLNNKINNHSVELTYKVKEKESEITSLKDKEIGILKEEYENKIKEKDEMINLLQRQKASLNVKQTGEDLESWCNNEVISYMQNGLLNCKWIKDNEVIKDEGESKGSKADYIFKIYAGEDKNEEDLLTSICMDMKDENPDSVNKKSNADYYKQLDKNRIKKNCKYALLVSNLEIDKPNDLPMFKVSDYKDMYVVRPAYLMTFLNMIASLVSRFATLVKADKQSKLDLKNAIDLSNQFDELKLTYLDKPLSNLESHVNDILKQNEVIMNASNKVSESCNKIINSYINQIHDKLSKFEIKINKEYKKYDRLEMNNETSN